METQSLQNLLTQISAILRQYDKIAELTGENFNIFKVLGVTTNEVRTHSAFIAELLNPTGSHGMKNAFLNLFIGQMQIENFISETAVVEIEKHIGYISNEYSEGGHIDIIITDKNKHAIIFENKIYADDQPSQLLRYYNYGKTACRSSNLFYLTLDGKDATYGSKKELKKPEDYNNISYSIDILDWLEKCKEKAVNHPILRETIAQYIFLIKYLTGQTTNSLMRDEIVTKIISDKENLTTFLTIVKEDVIKDVRIAIIKRLKEQVEEIGEELQLLTEFDPFFNGMDPLFTFRLNNSPIKQYYIKFVFCAPFTRLIYGIQCEENYLDEHRTILATRLTTGLGWEGWVWVTEFESPLCYWKNDVDPWFAVLNGSLKINIKSKVENIINNLIGCEM